MSIRIILENQLTCSLTLKTSQLDSQNVVLSFIFSIRFLPIQGFGCFKSCKNKPSLVSFRWTGHTYSTLQRAECQSQPGLWLLLRLPGHSNHKPLPVTDQDGECSLFPKLIAPHVPTLPALCQLSVRNT